MVCIWLYMYIILHIYIYMYIISFSYDLHIPTPYYPRVVEWDPNFRNGHRSSITKKGARGSTPSATSRLVAPVVVSACDIWWIHIKSYKYLCTGAIKSYMNHIHIKSCKYLSGWWLTYPSEKYESQLGWLFPIYMGKYICSKAPTSYVRLNQIKWLLSRCIAEDWCLKKTCDDFHHEATR